MIAFLEKRCCYFRLELAFFFFFFFFRAFDLTACGQTKVYFRELHNYIIFLQNLSELTISLLPEKNKLGSAYKLLKLAPDLIVPTVIMADILQRTACARANPIHNLLPSIGIFPNTFSCYNILIKRLIISFILITRNGVKQHWTRQLGI